jgi:hypothetical protein
MASIVHEDDLDLSCLTSTEGLKLPERLGWSLLVSRFGVPVPGGELGKLSLISIYVLVGLSFLVRCRSQSSGYAHF